MKNNLILGLIVSLIVGGVVGFFGGMQYQKSQRPNFAQGNFVGRENGQLGQRFGANGANRPVTGEIISADDKSITVKMQDGSSKIVILSDTTSINKQATGTKDDLKTGTNVAVFGSSNSDGSVTAQSIQLNPMLRTSPVPSK